MFYRATTNKFIHPCTIENRILSLVSLKDKKNLFLSKNSYMQSDIRRKRNIRFSLVTVTDKIVNFTFSGKITRKKKNYSLNSTVTISTLLSGKRVNVTVHPMSNSVNLLTK